MEERSLARSAPPNEHEHTLNEGRAQIRLLDSSTDAPRCSGLRQEKEEGNRAAEDAGPYGGCHSAQRDSSGSSTPRAAAADCYNSSAGRDREDEAKTEKNVQKFRQLSEEVQFIWEFARNIPRKPDGGQRQAARQSG